MAKMGRGLRQVCKMSPCFFNVYSEDTSRDALEDLKALLNLTGTRIINLRYADGTTLIRSSKDELMDLLNR